MFLNRKANITYSIIAKLVELTALNFKVSFSKYGVQEFTLVSTSSFQRCCDSTIYHFKLMITKKIDSYLLEQYAYKCIF